jgi:hypothetical protein
MVRAILEGRKTQTRRIIKPQPPECVGKVFCEHFEPTVIDRHGEMRPGAEIFGAYDEDGEWGAKCPYGQPGDRLWCKETHYRWGLWKKNGLSESGRQKWKFVPYNDEVLFPEAPPPSVFGNSVRECLGWFTRPSLFMDRKASRILLEIVSVRVERLQDISQADCIAEGIERLKSGRGWYDPTLGKGAVHFGHYLSTAKDAYATLWDDLNGTGSWDLNPWLWVVEFKRVEA